MSQEQDNQDIVFTDKKGVQHVGCVWPIVDCEGEHHFKFREAGTGRLFPIPKRLIPKPQEQPKN